jgi:hypothetical protein
MSKGELKSLNDLAMAHGGQLTINPQTGLPEAGFLSSILPMVAGAALNTFMPGLGAMGSALLTGAVSGIASGSLSKGLMAGMGAYGGAGLMGGLLGAGEGALAQTALNQSAAESARLGMSQAPFAAEAQAAASQAPFMDKMSAGFSKVGEAPGQFFKDNWKYAAAAAPSVIEAVSGSGGKAPTPASDKDMGQRYVYEPNKLQGPYTASPTGVEQQYFNPNFRKVSGAEAKSVFGYASGGAVDEPVKYDYDPLTQIFKKIESMPSDNQKVNEPSPIGGRGGANPNQARTNAYFDGMTPAQLAQHQQTQANVINALMPGSAVVAGLKALTGGESSNPISPLAVPSLAMSKLGDAAQTGLGLVLNKFAKPNPNPESVQVVDMSTLSPAAEGEQAQQQAQQAQQAQAIATALAGLQGAGGDGGMSAGFGAPGATSGNAGAMGFGPSGMAGGYGGGSTGATSGATGGGGAPGAPGLGANSGGGFATGPGGTSGVGGTAGAASGAANGGLMAAYASGGSHLGDYSDGGRLLKGPGDGVSDSIPAMIGKKQPARLADGEFVVPARIVSELGNGSTEAGARKLYAMMDRVQKARGSTVGKGRVAKNSRADKYLPA